MLTILFTFIIPTLILLSILVFVHELGHFLVAKKLGVKVEEFGFGLPPRLWGKQWGETMYSINWLPIGGFVRLLGEDVEEDEVIITNKEEKKQYFWGRSKKERAAVLLAGVTMNFTLAVIISSIIFMRGVYVPTERVHVVKVTENSPASMAGLLENDIIASFGGKSITTVEDLITITKAEGGKETPVAITRSGNKMTVLLTPRKDPPPNEGPLGITISNLEEKKCAWYIAPYCGLTDSIQVTYQMAVGLLTLLYKLVTFQPVGVDVAGPIGIAHAAGEAVKQGLTPYFRLMGIVSLNLALINILPIPALDGGRLLFVILEKFIGRRVKPQAERIVHQVGMMVLLALIALVTINDILRLVRG